MQRNPIAKLVCSNCQFGFRSGRSTEDQLLLTYSHIVREIDSGKVVDVVFLDFSKAFDVVCHQILLEKLRHLSFCPRIVNWIGDFLTERSMYVSVAGCSSEQMPVLSGVPQGSVLGPLLFLIYVNSIADGISCKWYAYADDFKVFLQYSADERVTSGNRIQHDLDLLCSRSLSWNLKLNSNKCVVMRFGCSYEDGGSGYFINDSELQLVKSHRDLGILVDHQLKFHLHVDTIVSKASQMANQLLRATICREPLFMVTLFISHIRPLLDYCSTVWNLGYVGDLDKLEKVQRRWTKQVVGLRDVPYESRLRQLCLYFICGRLLRGDLIKIWKAFHADNDVGLSQIFERQSHNATRGHRFKLSVPRCRLEIRRRFLSTRCVISWNALPAEIVESTSIDAFKSLLDIYFSDRFFDIRGT